MTKITLEDNYLIDWRGIQHIVLLLIISQENENMILTLIFQTVYWILLYWCNVFSTHKRGSDGVKASDGRFLSSSRVNLHSPDKAYQEDTFERRVHLKWKRIWKGKLLFLKYFLILFVNWRMVYRAQFVVNIVA